MKFLEFINLVLQVMQNWQVLVTLFGMLFVMGFANFIIKYRRKPKKAKKKTIQAAPTPAPAPVQEEAAMEAIE